MIYELSEEITLALALPVVAVVAQAAYSLRHRFCVSRRARCVGRIARLVVDGECDVTDLRRHHLRSTIVESMCFVSEYIYGVTYDRLCEVAARCEVELLPRSPMHLERVAMVVAERPERAIRYVATLEDELSWHDAALLFQLMRRTGAPIAYTPLLLSENRNLQLLGIYLCAHFSVVDAEPLLQRLVQSEDDDVGRAALYTLCSLKGDISTRQVTLAISRMAPHHRLALMRHMVQACYSLRSCPVQFTHEERARMAGIISSYKCKIVCN
jgi:hypothetical protein